MLKPYLESKIGSEISKRKKTGNDFFTEVFERAYSFEVVWVTDEEANLLMKSFDLAPSGYKKAGSDRDYGEVLIHIKDETSIENLLEMVIRKKDPIFIRKYFA